MRIWKIDGINDGLFVTSERGTHYDLVPEGDKVRVIDLDDEDIKSFNFENLRQYGKSIILTDSDGIDYGYKLSIDPTEFVEIMKLPEQERDDKIVSMTSEAVEWLKSQMD